jgi:hypothetical protein
LRSTAPPPPQRSRDRTFPTSPSRHVLIIPAYHRWRAFGWKYFTNEWLARNYKNGC